MPSIIATTTPKAMEAAIIARIAAIVPRHTSRQDGGWVPSEDNRPAGSSSLTPRLFHVEVTPGSFVPGGLTGAGDNECSLYLDVVADYRAFNEDELGTVIEADMWDLYDDLVNAINVIPGLTHCEISEEPSTDGDEQENRYRYTFELYYMRARR